MEKRDARLARLEAIFESAADSIIAVTPDGVVTDWNPGAERLYGYSAAEMIGRSSAELVPRDRQDELAGLLERIRRGERVERLQTERIRKDGSRVAVSATLAPIRDGHGRVVGAAAIDHEVTPLQAAEQTQQLMDAASRAFAGAGRGLDEILDGVADGVMVQDTAYGITYCNLAGARLLGFETPAEALATPLPAILTRFEVLDEAGQPLTRERFPGVRALAGEETPELLIRWRVRASGAERWSVVKARPLRGADGGVRAAISVFADVTEATRSARAQALLAAVARALAEARLDPEAVLGALARLVAERLGDGCAILLLAEDGVTLRRAAVHHPDPQVLAAIGALLEAAPVRADDRLGQQVIGAGEPLLWAELSPEAMRPLLREEYGAYLERFGARVGPYSLLAVPLRAGGRVLGCIVATRDAPGRAYTEDDRALLLEVADRAALAVDDARLYLAEHAARATAEAAGREAQALYQAALAIGGALDPGERLERVLDAALALVPGDEALVALERPDEGVIEVVAARGARILPTGYRQPLGTGLTGRVITGNAPLRSEDQAQDPRTFRSDTAVARGSRAWLGAPLADEHGAYGVLIVQSARTAAFGAADERRLAALAAFAGAAVREARLRRNLEVAVRARDEFLSVAAHELKTPTTSLRGFAQLLRRRLGRDEDQDPERLRRGLDVIDHQAERMMRLVNQLLDVSRLETGKLTLRPEAVDLVTLATDAVEALRARDAAHPVELEAPPSLPAWADPLRVEQVLANLLDNAAKFSPQGAVIELRLWQPDPETAHVEVRDHGLGIAPEHRGRIFGRFFQAHAEEYRSGLGLGLYIAKQIVELHRGAITAEFPTDGGTRVVVTLPVGAPPAAETPT